MKFKILGIVLGMICMISSNMYAYQNTNLWLRGTVTAQISSKIRSDFEYQHRRQNGFENHNPFDHTLMNSFRIWTHYQHNDKIRFTISPFSYFTNYRAIRKVNDIEADPRKEIRIGGAIELQHRLTKKLSILNREFVEYRIFLNGQDNVTRLRNRLGFRYDLSKKMKLFLFDELMVNLSGTTMEHFFDHNRLGLNFEYTIVPSFKIDLQYMYATRMPSNNPVIFSEHNFLIYFTYILPKKKKENQN